MSAVEQAPRVLGKEERRALLNYFVYRPPEDEKGAAAEPGGAGTGDRGVQEEEEGEEVVTPPPSYNGNITVSRCGGAGGQSSGERRFVLTMTRFASVLCVFHERK